MQTLKTHKGDTLLLIEVPLDAYDLRYKTMPDDTKQLVGSIKDDNGNIGTCYIRENPIGEIIGTTSTLTDEGVEPFVESKRIKESWNDTMTTVYLNYNNPNDELIGKYVKLPLESWNSFLQHNRVDLSKNWVVLKLKND